MIRRAARDTFFEHVARRADIPLDQAEPHALAVLAVLRRGVSDGEWQNIRAHLPKSVAESVAADVPVRRR